MNKKIFANIVFMLSVLATSTLFFVTCSSDAEVYQQSQDEPTSEILESNAASEFEKGFVRILVTDQLSSTMEEAVTAGQSATRALAADRLVSDINIRAIHRTFPYAGRFEERTRKAGLHLWYDVEFDTDMPLEKAKTGLANVIGVKKVELRPVVERLWKDEVWEFTRQVAQNAAAPASVTAPFNDPGLSKQWHYQNDGSLGDKFQDGADINLFGAWNYTTGSPEVVVAVIDGGVDYTHEDLAANMWVNTAENSGTSGKDDDGNGYKDDIHGYNFVSDVGKLVPHDHGTHVAGTIAAVNNNGKGVAGIAGGDGKNGSGVRIMSCQIFVDDDDPYAENAGQKGATAIKYAADNGAVICQNSWGYPTLTQIPASDKEAIDYFIEYAGIDENGIQTGPMKGGIVIFAAGNEDREAAAPANYEKVVAVSSIAADYKKAYYSNYGSWVDIAAPGGDVQSFGNVGTIYSTVVDGYGYMQGTSMACPHVSGVAALTLSHLQRKGFTPDMLRAKLEQSARSVDQYNASYKGKLGKLIDATGALASGSTTPPGVVKNLSGTAQSNILSLSWLVPSDADDGKPAGFNVYCRKTSLSGINVNNLPSDVVVYSFTIGNASVGSTFTAKVEGLDFESDYYVAVLAYDYSGNFSSLSSQIKLTTEANNPPIITVLDSASVFVPQYKKVSLRFSGSDPDGHSLSWNLDTSDGALSLTDLGDNKAQVSISGPDAQPGDYQATLSLQDAYGASSSLIIQYHIEPNRVPQLVSTIPNQYFGALNQEVSFSIPEYFIDPDGEVLRFTFNNPEASVVNVNVSQDRLYLVSLAYGLTTVSVTASDALGESVTQEFQVLIRDENKELDVYPNPTKDFVWIRTGKEESGRIRILNANGVALYDNQYDFSPFNPAKIDLTSFDGGVYEVEVNFNGKIIKEKIVKL